MEEENISLVAEIMDMGHELVYSLLLSRVGQRQ
jgi:hypothetical protein